ncbi:MAG: GIY-YIG nuclease family protein [Candidatus Cyclobacteriaceae bacterium M3_2C_046]
MNKYFVYVLLSKKDNKFYTGYTKDLNKRFEEHNQG